MATSRRNFVFFLGIGGATVATLTAAGFLYRAADRGSFSDLQSGRPFEPWHEWQRQRLPGTEGVALAGTLAASSFNTQPWLMRLDGDVIDLFFNRRSYTVFLDPFERQALIGLGTCVENMATAAEGLGRSVSIALFPDASDPEHIARLTLTAAAPKATPRFLAIGNRHTNRSAYDPAHLPPPDVMTALNSLSLNGPVRFSLFPANSQKGRAFIEGTNLATRAALVDPAMLAEQLRWFRQTMDQVRATMDGISFIGMGLTDLQVRTAMAMPEFGAEDYAQLWLDQTTKVQMPSSPLFGLIAVDQIHDPAQMIEAGRLLQRLHLEATAQGLAFQAIAQMNWMADREEARGGSQDFVERITVLAGDLGTMVLGLRLGYASRQARASARRAFPSVLLPRIRPLRSAPERPARGPVTNRPKE